MTLIDDMQALVNQVAANTSAIAALQANVGSSPVPTVPSSGWPIIPQQFDPMAGTAGHDSTSAIASAIAACPSGGAVHIPATASGYTISSGFTITQPINIIGDGFGTKFVGSLPANVDLFHVACPAATWLRGLSFKNFQIALTGGQHWFHLDTNAVPAAISEVEISNILASAPGGNAIFIDNTPSNPDGGCYNCWFEKNELSVNNGSGACISINNGGDSIRIRDGILNGIGYAIYVNQIANAGNLVIEGPSIEATGGIVIARAIKPIIRDFEMEFTQPLLTGAAIDFAGSNGLIDGATIGPGQIQIAPGTTGFGEAIYLANASNVTIDGIRFASAVGGIAINIAAAASNTHVGTGNSYSGFTSNILGSYSP